MKKTKSLEVQKPEEKETKSMLDEVVRQGAQKMLKAMLNEEVADFCRKHEDKRDESGHRLIVRNGYHRSRQLVTGAGQLDIQLPRVDDRALEGMEENRFQSSLIPPYLKRTQNIEEFVPYLYLKGISTGDFTDVMEKLTRKKVAGFSPVNIVRMKQIWEREYKSWIDRDFSNSAYVYWWVDGIHFNVRLDHDRQCILVIIGAKEDGTKELVAVEDGFRESKESWQSILRDLKRRGLKAGPKLAIGDGALGFWAVLPEEFSDAKTQGCWVHKTANVLDKLPTSRQAKGKQMIHDIYLSPTKDEAKVAFDEFIKEFDLKYPRAVKSLTDNRDRLLSFYDFPAENWQSIRSTNVIESTFATVRLRTKKTKGCGSRIATLTMVFKLAESAQKRWRKLRGHKKLPAICNGVKFENGVEVKMAA